MGHAPACVETPPFIRVHATTHRVREHAGIPRGQHEPPGRGVEGHEQRILAQQLAAAQGAHLDTYRRRGEGARR